MIESFIEPTKILFWFFLLFLPLILFLGLYSYHSKKDERIMIKRFLFLVDCYPNLAMIEYEKQSNTYTVITDSGEEIRYRFEGKIPLKV